MQGVEEGLCGGWSGGGQGARVGRVGGAVRAGGFLGAGPQGAWDDSARVSVERGLSSSRTRDARPVRSPLAPHGRRCRPRAFPVALGAARRSAHAQLPGQQPAGRHPRRLEHRPAAHALLGDGEEARARPPGERPFLPRKRSRRVHWAHPAGSPAVRTRRAHTHPVAPGATATRLAHACGAPVAAGTHLSDGRHLCDCRYCTSRGTS